jgi:hypothetical protein
MGSSEMRKHHGSVQAWLRYHTSMDAKISKKVGCWRYESDVFCGGIRDTTVTVISVPVILMLTYQDVENRAEQVMSEDAERLGDQPWDFPSKLTLPESDHQTIQYDIIGRIFFNGTHYCARFRGYTPETSNHIFQYDGMKSNGFCQRVEQGNLLQHLAGPDKQLSDIPTGYRTCMVLYRLQGGYDSQKRFYQSQITKLTRIHGLSFSSNDLNTLPFITLTRPGYHLTDNADRYWMINPFNHTLADYEKMPDGTASPDDGLSDFDKELLNLAEQSHPEPVHSKRVFSDSESDTPMKKRRRSEREELAAKPGRSTSGDHPLVINLLTSLMVS